MKQKITFGAIIVAIGIAITVWLGGFTSNPKTTPEQLPVNASAGVYGNSPETADIWPVWSLQVIWKRQSVVYRDNVGPFLYQLQLKTRPTLADVEKLIPQPNLGEGIYKPVLLLNVVQVGDQQPIGVPEPK